MTLEEYNNLKSNQNVYCYSNSITGLLKGKEYPVQGFSDNKRRCMIGGYLLEASRVIDNFELIPEGTKVIPIPEGYRVQSYSDEEITLTSEPLNYEVINAINLRKGLTNYITVACPNAFYSKMDAILKLSQVALYLNEGWKPDWNNKAEGKYTFTLDFSKYSEGEIQITSSTSTFPIYFKSKELAERAIRILGEQIIKNILV